jgi:hypothetical protein
MNDELERIWKEAVWPNRGKIKAFVRAIDENKEKLKP